MSRVAHSQRRSNSGIKGSALMTISTFQNNDTIIFLYWGREEEEGRGQEQAVVEI